MDEDAGILWRVGRGFELTETGGDSFPLLQQKLGLPIVRRRLSDRLMLQLGCRKSIYRWKRPDAMRLRLAVHGEWLPNRAQGRKKMKSLVKLAT